MSEIPLAIVYTWQHRESNNSIVPIHARAVSGGIVIQFLDGTVKIYKRQTMLDEKGNKRFKYRSVATVIGTGFSKLRNNNGIIEVAQYDTPTGERDAVFVAGQGCTIKKYDIPSGRLLAQGTLPFECRGLNVHLNKKLLVAWGYSCEMVVLDQITLKVKGRWTSLPDWPVPTSLLEDWILIFFKSGHASYWVVHEDKDENDAVQQIGNITPLIRLPPPPASSISEGEDDNTDEKEWAPKMIRSRKQSTVTMYDKLHGFDPLITVKQVTTHAWVAARRHGWMLYKWEDGDLVDEISSEVSEGIISIIVPSTIEKSDTQTFGILTRTSKIIWVSQGNVQVIEPLWNPKNDEIVASAVYSTKDHLLSAFVVTEHGIDTYFAATDSHVIQWDPVPFRLQTFKKTTSYVSGVTADGEQVVIGRGNELLLLTPAQFLGSEEDEGKVIYSLKPNHRVTMLESIESDTESLIAAGTSDGRIIEVNSRTAQVLYSLEVFATSVTRIIWLSVTDTNIYQNFILAISLDSSVALIDRALKKVWKLIPGNDLDIISVSFTKQNPCWIVIEYEDHQKRIWDLDTSEEVDDMAFYSALMQSSDGVSITSVTSRRSRFDQTEKNKELDKLPNILIARNNGQEEYPLIMRPKPYSKAPLMVLRTDYVIEKFKDALDAGDMDRAEKLSVTANALCQSMFHLPHDIKHDPGLENMHLFLKKMFPQVDKDHEELGLGLLTSVDHVNDLTLFSMQRGVPTTLLQIDGETTSRVLVVWMTLVQLLSKYMKIELPSISYIFDAIESIENIEKPNFIGLAKILLMKKPFLHENAQLFMTELIKRVDIAHVISVWRPYLLKIKTKDICSYCNYAMLILSCLSIYFENHDIELPSDFPHYSRELAQTLANCILDSGPDHSDLRILAIQLMGRGWDQWQKYINPFNVLHSLIDLLYKNGFVSVPGSRASSPDFLSETIKRELVENSKISIREIATQNATLLVSVLSLYIKSANNPTDARISALRLLTTYITPNPPLITAPHLPTIISTLVHLLDPNTQSTREVADGGVSLVTEITQFLIKALNQYPAILTFHKAAQRLAMSLDKGTTASVDNIVLGFVYDLRSGATVASLSLHQGVLPVPDTQTSVHITPGEVALYDISFSPDGKAVSGIVETSGYPVIVVWKLGGGLFSLIQNISNPFTTTQRSGSTSPASGSITPVKPLVVLEDQNSIGRITVYPKIVKPLAVKSPKLQVS